MKGYWWLGVGVMLSLLVLDQARSFGGHGHTGGTHAAKETHEPPKHSSGKAAPHSAAKPSPKSQAKPQPKSLPTPHGKPKDTNAHKPELGKSGPQHESNLKRPNSIGSSSKTHEQTTKDDKTTHHDAHHDEHHGWHHDRWWHGHHHVWSADGYWVDAATGQPVVAGDAGVPAGGGDGTVTGPTAGAAGGGRPQVHFSVDDSERDSYDAAAQAAGVSRAEWIRSRLNAAVHQELK